MPSKDIEKRPPIATIKSGNELKRWYWMKDELIVYARTLKLKTVGGKFTILERIAHFLDTGSKTWPGDIKQKVTSKFDWHSEDLTPETIITDSYKTSQNVRRFFQTHADPKFSFSIAFMEWIKANIGKTLGDAMEEYHDMKRRTADPGFKTDIKPHNQFNQYTRDFMADNPDASISDVRRIWALKRALPAEDGRHVYEKLDLELK